MFEQLRTFVEAHTPSVIRVILILALAWALHRTVRGIIKRVEKVAVDGDPSLASEHEKRAQTLSRILRQVSAVAIWSVTIMLVLAEMGVDLKPFLAGAGILGLAVGFGAQALVKDVITGFFILLENQIRVGDTITAAGCSGVVEAVNLRTTVLRDVDGRTHIVPNSAITVVTNATRDWSRALLDVGVAYKEDVDRCLSVMREVGAELERDPDFSKRIIGSFEYQGVQEFGPSSVVLRMVAKTQPQDGAIVLRELRRRVKHAFDEAGIEVPYPYVKLVSDARKGA